MHRSFSTLALGAALMLAASAAPAQELKLKIGYLYIRPNSTATDVVGSVAPPGLSLQLAPVSTLALSLILRLDDDWDAELAAGIPPTANAKLVVRNSNLNETTRSLAGQTAAKVLLVSPTFYINRNFGDPSNRVRPFVGLGLNVTYARARSTSVNDEVNLGPTTISLSPSWGLAGQVGVNVKLTDTLFVSAALAKANVNTTMTSITETLGSDIDLRLARSAKIEAKPTLFTLTVGGSF